MDSEKEKLIDREMLKKYYASLAIIIIGLFMAVLGLFLGSFMFPVILIGFLISFIGVYGAYRIRSNKEKLLKISSREKVIIGLSGFGGILNIIIGLSSLSGSGFLGTISVLGRTFIGITFIPSGILAIVGAFIELKSLFIGGVLCLIAGILSIVLPLIGNYYYFYGIIVSAPYFYFPTVFIIVGGILGILEYKKIK